MKNTLFVFPLLLMACAQQIYPVPQKMKLKSKIYHLIDSDSECEMKLIIVNYGNVNIDGNVYELNMLKSDENKILYLENREYKSLMFQGTKINNCEYYEEEL